jgi:glucosamine--fructose-6-phosphate aminotransferase (isomerizing)
LTLALAKRRGLDAASSGLGRRIECPAPPGRGGAEAERAIEQMAQSFADKDNALFLGRGTFYPVAMEGALKLKEISYIHAEAYPAGELKHGPLALVDDRMPVICALPDDPLLEKVLSNLQEVRARGGELFLFSDQTVQIDLDHYQNLTLDDICHGTAPIVYTIPLQLLSYHVAVLKGTDVDQPRNLAKSVTRRIRRRSHRFRSWVPRGSTGRRWRRPRRRRSNDRPGCRSVCRRARSRPSRRPRPR